MLRYGGYGGGQFLPPSYWAARGDVNQGQQVNDVNGSPQRGAPQAPMQVSAGMPTGMQLGMGVQMPGATPASQKPQKRKRPKQAKEDANGKLLPKFTSRKSLNSCSQKVKDHNAATHSHVQHLFDALLMKGPKHEFNHTAMLIQVMCDESYQCITPAAVDPGTELLALPHSDLVVMVKKNQRDAQWNTNWKQYCSSHAPSRRRDPAAHVAAFLASAVTYCNRKAQESKEQEHPGLFLLSTVSGTEFKGLHTLLDASGVISSPHTSPAPAASTPSPTPSLAPNQSPTPANTSPTPFPAPAPTLVPVASYMQPPNPSHVSQQANPAMPPSSHMSMAPQGVPGAMSVAQGVQQVSQAPPTPPMQHMQQPPQQLPATNTTASPTSQGMHLPHVQQSSFPAASNAPKPPPHPPGVGGVLIMPQQAMQQLQSAPGMCQGPFPPGQEQHQMMPGHVTPPAPGSAVHSRTTSFDIDGWNQPSRAPPPHPMHNRTISMDSMPQLLTGSPLPGRPGTHSRTTSIETQFPPMGLTHSPRAQQGMRRSMHNRTISTDSLGVPPHTLHNRTTSFEVPPSLVSELSTASPSPCPPSPFEQGTYPPHMYSDGPISPMGPHDWSGPPGHHQQPSWNNQSQPAPQLEPYLIDNNTYCMNLAKGSQSGVVALRREWSGGVEYMFEGITMKISENSGSVQLTGNVSCYMLLKEAAGFLQAHYLSTIKPPMPGQEIKLPQGMVPAKVFEPQVGMDVETLGEVDKVKLWLDATEGVGWVEEQAPYCGQPAKVIRFDSDDRSGHKCRLRFPNGVEYTWSLAALKAPPGTKPYPPPPPPEEPAPAQSSRHKRTVQPRQPLPTGTVKDPNLITAISSIIALVACVARDESLPLLPRVLPPRPEFCMKCGAKWALVTMKQRKGSRLRSYRFECSKCETQHLQSKDTGLCRVARKDHLATPNAARLANKLARKGNGTSKGNDTDDGGASNTPAASPQEAQVTPSQ
eukprot:TRINITY_DN2448_c8_g1_i1.p1 TRINITY_DN2448_c8_g1~~TRINITY_DN2448_c8_g1_i1.p1  ORF type:complete len:1003 (+),score=221.95 TRINITY_DN2448_c8_g1_i1:75-3011(+)